MTFANIQFSEPLHVGRVALHDVAVRLHERDDVAIAKQELSSGVVLLVNGANAEVAVRQFVPARSQGCAAFHRRGRTSPSLRACHRLCKTTDFRR
jgi:hypothetical protein